MPIQSYQTPYEIELNRDSEGNPVTVVVSSETHTIYDNQLLLAQIPSEFFKVVISGKYEKSINSTLTSTDFKVDYENGVVYFHESLEGYSITVNTYHGRGIKLLYASRVKLIDIDNLFTSINVEGGMKELAQRVDNLINGTEQPSEVIDAHFDGTTTYPNLKNRLDNSDTQLASKVAKSSIANNLVTTAEGLVLDARQGKELKDSAIKVEVLSQVQFCITDTTKQYIFDLSPYSNIQSTFAMVTGVSTLNNTRIIRTYGTNNTFEVVSGTSQDVYVTCTVLYK